MPKTFYTLLPQEIYCSRVTKKFNVYTEIFVQKVVLSHHLRKNFIVTTVETHAYRENNYRIYI